VKKICQELSIIRNKKVNNNRKIRLDKIQNIRNNLEEDPTNSKLQLELNSQLREEEIWQVIEAKRIRRFSRFHWVKNGDLPTKFFFHYLRNKSLSPPIRSILGEEDEKVIEEEDYIIEEFQNYYSKLFQANKLESTIHDYVDSRIVSKLTREEKIRLEEEISFQEIEEAIMKLAKGKSLGLDGIPNYFYQNMWSVIGEDLTRMIQIIFDKGRIPKEMNKSLIVLIPKKIDPKRVRDYRPISLLGGVYKIIAKILADRIRILITKLVHNNQTGFIHGRSLIDNCLSIWTGVEEGHKLGRYLLLKVDFEKAYDRIEWKFLYACSEAMNFGPNFFKCVG